MRNKPRFNEDIERMPGLFMKTIKVLSDERPPQ